MGKLIKKHKDLIIIGSLLLILVVFMVLTTFTFSYFSNNKTILGEIQLGELDYDIIVRNMPVNSLLPGDNINIDVSIRNQVANKYNLIPFYFRFKVFNNNETYSSRFVTLTSGDNFIVSDNYYYYKFKVNVGDTVRLIRNLSVDTALTQQEADNINLEILVEAVQSEYGAYLDIFPDAPESWIDFIENN